jgi:hypothetical protein
MGFVASHVTVSNPFGDLVALEEAQCVLFKITPGGVWPDVESMVCLIGIHLGNGAGSWVIAVGDSNGCARHGSWVQENMGVVGVEGPGDDVVKTF